MTRLRNSAPRVIFNGIDDQSVEALVPELLQFPIHFPLMYLQTRKGRLDPQSVTGNDAIRLYGRETFNVRSDYYTHQTALAEAIMGRGNSILLKRLEPQVDGSGEDVSLTAKVLLWAVVDAGTGAMPEYERGPDGRYTLDQNGNPTLTVGGTVADGLKVTWKATSIDELPSGTPLAPVTNGDITEYPCFIIEAGSYGEWGNLVGTSLWSQRDPETGYVENMEVANLHRTIVYAGSIVEKQTATSTPGIQRSLLGETEVDFAFKEGVYDPVSNRDMPFSRLVDDYEDDGLTTGSSPQWGSLGNVTVLSTYGDLLTALMTVEQTKLPTDGDFPDSEWEDATLGLESGWALDATNDLHLLDVFTGKDKYGIPHFGFYVADASAAGEVDMVQGEYTYLLDGADGDLDMATYNVRVADEVDLYRAQAGRELMDMKRYPFSCVYDSGFEDSTKEALAAWISHREDVHVTLATHVHGQAPMTPADEYAAGVVLKGYLATYTESELYGTPAVRGVIMSQSGIPLTVQYNKRVPMTFELAIKRADYMGSGQGRLDPTQNYTLYPGNTVQFMKDVNATYLNKFLADKAWADGINYCEFSDSRTLFYPVIQSIYDIKNSVLVGELFMALTVDVKKRSSRVWTQLSGRSDLTEAEFIEESNAIFLDEVAGRYDGQITVVPSTEFTPADSARGNTWVQNVEVFGNVPKTVAQVNVITRRQA